MDEIFSRYSQIKKENNKIYYNGFSGEQFIGYTVEAYEELQQAANEAIKQAEQYYQMLVDNKVITPKKTQEEINTDIINSIKTLVDSVSELKEGLKELKNESIKFDKRKDEPKTRNPRSSESGVANG